MRHFLGNFLLPVVNDRLIQNRYCLLTLGMSGGSTVPEKTQTLTFFLGYEYGLIWPTASTQSIVSSHVRSWTSMSPQSNSTCLTAALVSWWNSCTTCQHHTPVSCCLTQQTVMCSFCLTLIPITLCWTLHCPTYCLLETHFLCSFKNPDWYRTLMTITRHHLCYVMYDQCHRLIPFHRQA